MDGFRNSQAACRAAGFSAGPVLGAVNKGDRITGQGMSAQAIYELVDAYGNQCASSERGRRHPG
jgi:hypothetical protein